MVHMGARENNGTYGMRGINGELIERSRSIQKTPVSGIIVIVVIIIIIIFTVSFCHGSRMERWKKFFLKKSLLGFSFNSWAVRRHLEKWACLEFDCQILRSWASMDVVTNLEGTVFHTIDMRSVWVHALTELLTGFSNVCRIASAAEHYVNDVFG